MAITARVQNQYFVKNKGLIRLAPNQDPSLRTKRAGTPWTLEEHDRFLEALERYPSGPWKSIAAYIGTRTTRQTMTHAQKYREKIARRQKAKAEAASKVKSEAPLEAVVTRCQMSVSARDTASITAPSSQVPKNESTFISGSNQLDSQVELDASIIAFLESLEPLELTFDPLERVTCNCWSTSLLEVAHCI
ncbi:unnamed protein product [Phytophthora lilii]|uniref:Unnamed protein product n=1 Tax=Phytophthora lilii TaxID=2077276 RepID=A0A9W6WTC8_9STRA|nr:unnamed protein product [Phytophthora lilii]